VILERPWDDPASRVTGELTALVGARVTGEHRHPALVEQFTVLERGFQFQETMRHGPCSKPITTVAVSKYVRLGAFPVTA
jgi:hypothetical protein